MDADALAKVRREFEQARQDASDASLLPASQMTGPLKDALARYNAALTTLREDRRRRQARGGATKPPAADPRRPATRPRRRAPSKLRDATRAAQRAMRTALVVEDAVHRFVVRFGALTRLFGERCTELVDAQLVNASAEFNRLGARANAFITRLRRAPLATSSDSVRADFYKFLADSEAFESTLLDACTGPRASTAPGGWFARVRAYTNADAPPGSVESLHARTVSNEAFVWRALDDEQAEKPAVERAVAAARALTHAIVHVVEHAAHVRLSTVLAPVEEFVAARRDGNGALPRPDVDVDVLSSEDVDVDELSSEDEDEARADAVAVASAGVLTALATCSGARWLVSAINCLLTPTTLVSVAAGAAFASVFATVGVAMTVDVFFGWHTSAVRALVRATPLLASTTTPAVALAVAYVLTRRAVGPRSVVRSASLVAKLALTLTTVWAIGSTTLGVARDLWYTGGEPLTAAAAAANSLAPKFVYRAFEAQVYNFPISPKDMQRLLASMPAAERTALYDASLNILDDKPPSDALVARSTAAVVAGVNASGVPHVSFDAFADVASDALTLFGDTNVAGGRSLSRVELRAWARLVRCVAPQPFDEELKPCFVWRVHEVGLPKAVADVSAAAAERIGDSLLPGDTTLALGSALITFGAFSIASFSNPVTAIAASSMFLAPLIKRELRGQPRLRVLEPDVDETGGEGERPLPLRIKQLSPPATEAEKTQEEVLTYIGLMQRAQQQDDVAIRELQKQLGYNPSSTSSLSLAGLWLLVLSGASTRRNDDEDDADDDALEPTRQPTAASPSFRATNVRANVLQEKPSREMLSLLLAVLVDRPTDGEVRLGGRAIQQGYGEVLPAFINWLIDTFAVSERDVFVDIGSGVGNVVIQVAALTGADAVGFDNTRALVDAGVRNIAQMKFALSAQRLTMGHAYSIEADAQRSLPWPTRIAAARMLVFVDNFLFSDELSTNIMRNLVVDARVLPGTRVLLTVPIRWSRQDEDTELFRRFDMLPSVLATPRNIVSWSKSALAPVLYTVRAYNASPTFVAEYRSRYEHDVIRARARQYQNIGER